MKARLREMEGEAEKLREMQVRALCPPLDVRSCMHRLGPVLQHI